MALKSANRKLKKEQQECQKAWDLLSTVPEYINEIGRAHV